MTPIRHTCAATLTAALFVSGVPAAAAAADGPEVVARTGVLKTRPAGMPSAGAADSQRLESAKVRQDIEGYRAKATVVLRAAPGPGATLAVGFGAQEGSQCVSEVTFTTPTVGQPSAGFTVSGRTVTLDADSVDARTGDWDCAFVATGAADGTTYDALVGPMKDVAAKPTLKIRSIDLLDRKQQRLGLVPGVWTPIDVTVANTSRYRSSKVTVSGKGKGVKVRQGAITWLNRGGKDTARVQVKLTAKRATKLTLVARSGGAKTTRSLPVRPVKAPPRPKAGAYRASVDPGRLTFRIAGGKVKAFKARGVRMTCQTPGEYATYRTVDLNFPKAVTIPRNGIVDVTHRWRKGNAWYNASLRMRVAGGKVSQGNFTFSTADWCLVDDDFTARR
jgi:hypothetical protein